MYDKNYTQRAVGTWNALPGGLVKVDTMVVFKRLLDKHMKMQNLRV